MERPARTRRSILFLHVAALLAICGCTNIAEDVATHLASRELKLEHDLKVIHGDLALFRQCFEQRGGQCSGSSQTALPHTTNAAAGTAVASSKPGASQHLSDSVAKLSANHPAKAAYAALQDPVVQKAAAMHDLLRGVGEAAAAPGVTMTRQSDGSATLDVHLPVKQAISFHSILHSAASSGGWKALHGHCQEQIARGGLTGAALADLERDCRVVAFVKTYLEAYFRQGEFIKVQTGLSGLTQDVNQEAVVVYTMIKTVVAGFQQVQAQAATATSYADVASDVQELQAAVAAAKSALGSVAGKIGDDLGDLLGREVDLASSIVAPPPSASGTATPQQIQEAVAGLDKEISALVNGFHELGKQVGDLATDVDDKINDLVGAANKKLSNVFKISQVGFVSRDTTFQARLPTIELTFDPTLKKHFLTIEDVDTGATITGKTDLADLGVATDVSGVTQGLVSTPSGGPPSSQIGIELVRVFLEAVFDAHEGLPAVAPVNQGAQAAQATAPTGLSIKPDTYSLPAFQDPMGAVSAADLTEMTKLNSRAASTVSSILGSAIGGIGPLSLNNQTLENFIVEIVATTVRKVVEKVTWCWYSCNLDQAVKQAEADALALLKAEAEEVEDEVKAKAKKEEKKAEAYLHAEAQQIRLKLRLGS